MIIDTDVLIWHLRGNERARNAISRLLPFSISVITYAELIEGMRDKLELDRLKRQLKRWSVRVLQIDRDISTKAMFYVEEFALSHSMEFADAVIGATALRNNEMLLTGNDMHYRHIPGIRIERFSAE